MGPIARVAGSVVRWRSHLPCSCCGPFHPKTSSLSVSDLVVAVQMSLENMTASRTQKNETTVIISKFLLTIMRILP